MLAVGITPRGVPQHRALMSPRVAHLATDTSSHSPWNKEILAPSDEPGEPICFSEVPKCL